MFRARINFRQLLCCLLLAGLCYGLLSRQQHAFVETSPLTSRIVAVGDIHGDLDHLLRILKRARLIGEANEWIGGSDTLVQTGDIVDRGKDTIALYRFFDALRPQAQQSGGRVVNLLGNHELMNAFGDWRYVTKEDIDSFGGTAARRRAISTGFIGSTWRSNYSITSRVEVTNPHVPADESRAASFVHGGITPSYLRSLDAQDPVRTINAIGHGLLSDIVKRANPLQFPRDATPVQREFWSERGPMWDRSYALDDDEDAVCARAREAARMLKVRHLIMGHTPFFEAIRSRCRGLVLLIDTGISRAYGGSLSALELMTTWSKLGNGTWLETEVVNALYTNDRSTEELARDERLLL